MRVWPIGLALLLLAGCQTLTPEERRAADEQICREFGFKKRNDAFAACMQRMDLDRRAQRRANQAEFNAFHRDYWRYRRPVIIYQKAQ